VAPALHVQPESALQHSLVRQAKTYGDPCGARAEDRTPRGSVSWETLDRDFDRYESQFERTSTTQRSPTTAAVRYSTLSTLLVSEL
jgi:hypothetical protein